MNRTFAAELFLNLPLLVEWLNGLERQFVALVVHQTFWANDAVVAVVSYLDERNA